MKKRLIIAIIATLILINSVYLVSAAYPTDCEEASIKTAWESILKESSSDTTIETDGNIVDGHCEKFEIFKYINEDGYDRAIYLIGNKIGERIFINSLYMEFEDENNNTDFDTTEYTEDIALFFVNKINDKTYVPKIRVAPDTNDAITEATNRYKKDSSDTSSWSNKEIYFRFFEEDTTTSYLIDIHKTEVLNSITYNFGTDSTIPDDNNNNGDNNNNNNNQITTNTTNNASTTNTTTSSTTCTPNWECADWSDTDNSCGTRTCTDSNNCGTASEKPEESTSCNEEKSSIVFWIIILLIIVAIIIIAVIIYKLYKKAKDQQDIKNLK